MITRIMAPEMDIKIFKNSLFIFTVQRFWAGQKTACKINVFNVMGRRYPGLVVDSHFDVLAQVDISCRF
jgi:hypothetical protein